MTAYGPDDVTAVLVTRGDHPETIAAIVETLIFPNVIVWDNGGLVSRLARGIASTRGVVVPDYGAYGRWQAILSYVSTPLSYVQDDDCTVDPDAQAALLAAHEPGVFTSNMHDWHNAGMPLLALPGWGAIVEGYVIQAATTRWALAEPDDFLSDDWMRIGCDIVIPVLSRSRMVDLGHTNMQHAYGDDRTHQRPDYKERKQWYYGRAAELRRELDRAAA